MAATCREDDPDAMTMKSAIVDLPARAIVKMFSALSFSREVVIIPRIWSAVGSVRALEIGSSCQNGLASVVQIGNSSHL